MTARMLPLLIEQLIGVRIILSLASKDEKA
jgi:hypothetical protein